MVAKLRLNHFFWSLPTVPLAMSAFMATFTGVSSADPFWSTAPYCSCVTTWPATGPYYVGRAFRSRLTSGTSRIIAWQRLICTD